MSEFLGTKQLKNIQSLELKEEDFKISPPHQVVRHPWYTLILVALWIRDLYFDSLVFNIFVTFYFLIGARIEEKRLLSYFGDRYSYYQTKVPFLVPLPLQAMTAQRSDLMTAKPYDSNRLAH